MYLFIRVPKGFFPQQDTGRLNGSIQADQDTSFQAMDKLLLQDVDVIDSDPAIDTVNGFTGGGRGGATNTARMFISLKPLEERKVSADEIIAACARSWRESRARRSICRQCRICASAAGRATRSINSRCAATTCRT